MASGTEEQNFQFCYISNLLRLNSVFGQCRSRGKIEYMEKGIHTHLVFMEYLQ